MLVEPDTMPRSAAGGGSRTDTERIDSERINNIRAALVERHAELAAEYAEAVAEVAISGAVDSGDDVADLGTKAFAREQEYAVATTIRGRMDQVERAMQRLDQGRYGSCESCALEIPVARLAAFPAVTLCVGCKALEERNH